MEIIYFERHWFHIVKSYHKSLRCWICRIWLSFDFIVFLSSVKYWLVWVISCSARIFNRDRERLQFCLTLFLIWNQLDKRLAVLTVALWWLYKLCNSRIKWGGKPISSMLSHSWSCLTTLESFCKSVKQRQSGWLTSLAL